ncbi:DUF6624 domain-containing protein [Mucilaginibacter litoreus]|uniref:DUF6624 domain-containing protein n=1 Tax=Mucilaginibacter litoreus TaxID=1048221 RepID=A0ABW3AXK1_9SPHI
MKFITITSGLFLLATAVTAQQKIDSALYKQISSMYKEDQKWRIEANKLYKKQKSDYDQATVDKSWAITDSTNEVAAKQILARYGYPGYSLVGESGSSRFWAIVQHCDDDVKFQQRVLVLMKKEVKRHNASGEDFAYLKDRVLVNLGKPQLYGTQARLNNKTNKFEPVDLTDARNVDKRRRQVGLGPLKDYLAQLNAN